MKLDEGFLIRNIAGEDILVPVGSKAVDFNGLITLTPVAAYIFRLLEEGKSEGDLVESILQEYEVDRQTAEDDLTIFLESLREQGVLCDE